LIICLLLIANYFQTQSIDPLNSPALDKLIRQLDENPQNDALRSEIRALDLLARKAYFTSIWQIEVGGYLLLCGVIIMLAALKIASNLKKQLPNPKEKGEMENQWLSDVLARRVTIISGLVILVFAILAGILARNDLRDDSAFANVAAFASKEEIEQNWPAFRGPWGNGHAFVKNVPTKWNGKTSENIIWKTEVPRQGYNSPIVWKDKVFLSGGDKKVREVYCFSTDDGRILWQKPVPQLPGSTGEEIEVDEGTGYAAPTMTTNGRSVFAIFATGELVCFNINGEFLWGQNLGVPENHYGHSSSLIVHENLLFVQIDDSKDPRVMAFEIANGKLSWEGKREAMSWASPILVNTGKRMELILANSKNVNSYDPASGKKLWEIECLSGEVGPSAVYSDGMVFAANEYAQGVGIKINSDGTAKTAWIYYDDLPNTSSPVATEKYLLLATSDAYLSCLNAKTGEMIWEHEFDYGCYCSPLVAGDLVYLVDLKGITHVFKLGGNKYEAVADNELSEGSSCTPAIVDGRIYIHGDKHLFCIGTN
jgi:outer membrane protein assembly factor BamB